MKSKCFLLLLFFFASLTGFAQQNQEMKRSKTPFLFPEFREATIRQTFNRKRKDTVNIYLKDASLFFRKDGKYMRAYLNNIIGVDFDSLHYMKVDSALALVVAQKGYNYLLKKTVVNMAKYKDELYGSSDLDHFEMEDFGVYLNLNEDKRDDDIGIPLQDVYYFNIKGTVIRANESSFKKFVSADQKEAFYVLKENRFWSWKDAESLKMLLDFLPD